MEQRLFLEKSKNFINFNKLNFLQVPWIEKEWFIFLQNFFKYDFYFLNIYLDKIFVGCIPVFESKKLFLKLAGSPLPGTFTPYLGFLPVSNFANLSENFLEKLLKDLRKFFKNYSFFQIIFLSEFSDRINFSKLTKNLKQFSESISSTYLVSVVFDEEQMWKKITSRCRNMIRKAQKNNVRIINVEPASKILDFYYSMLEDTLARRGAKVYHSKDFFEELFKKFYPENLLFLASEVNGKIASMGIFLYNQNLVIYLSGASLPEYNKYAPNNLLHWEVIKFAIKNKISYYDLGGRGIPSIDKFKESFGGKVIEFYGFRFNSLAFDWSFKLYKKLIKIFK